MLHACKFLNAALL